eukprot:s181_g48.t1
MAIAACVRQIVAKPMQASQGRIGVRHEVAWMAQALRAPVAAAERLTRTVSGLKSDAVPASNAERMGLAALATSAGICRRRVGRRYNTVATAATATLEAPAEILRKDYQQPSFFIREVTLTVRIFDGRTEVEEWAGIQDGSSTGFLVYKFVSF